MNLPTFAMPDFSRLFRSPCLSTRTGALMIAASIPAILCCLLLTVPSLVFNIPGDHAYYQFAKGLEVDRISLLPITLTTICLFLALILPLNPTLAAFKRAPAGNSRTSPQASRRQTTR